MKAAHESVEDNIPSPHFHDGIILPSLDISPHDFAFGFTKDLIPLEMLSLIYISMVFSFFLVNVRL